MKIYRHHLRALDRQHHAGHPRHIGPETKHSIVHDIGESVTTLALGTIHGRYAGMPEAKIGGVAIPLDFAIALFAKLVQYLPFSKPDYVSTTADVVGRGALVYYTASLGQALGQKWRAKSVGLSGAAPVNRAITQGTSRYDVMSAGRPRVSFDPQVLEAAVYGRS